MRSRLRRPGSPVDGFLAAVGLFHGDLFAEGAVEHTLHHPTVVPVVFDEQDPAGRRDALQDGLHDFGLAAFESKMNTDSAGSVLRTGQGGGLRAPKMLVR